MADALPINVARFGDWEDDTYEHMLLDPGFSEVDWSTIEFVDDLTAWELTTSGYSRQAVTGNVIVDSGWEQWLNCDEPDFSGMDAGDPVQYMVTTRVVNDDTDSRPLWVFALAAPGDPLDSGEVSIIPFSNLVRVAQHWI